MKWVEPDAAPAGVKDGISQKVVQIHDHRTQHDNSRLPLILLHENSGQNKGHHQMTEVVDDRSD